MTMTIVSQPGQFLQRRTWHLNEPKSLAPQPLHSSDAFLNGERTPRKFTGNISVREYSSV